MTRVDARELIRQMRDQQHDGEMRGSQSAPLAVENSGSELEKASENVWSALQELARNLLREDVVIDEPNHLVRLIQARFFKDPLFESKVQMISFDENDESDFVHSITIGSLRVTIGRDIYYGTSSPLVVVGRTPTKR